MAGVAYDGLADVYDWLVPEALLTAEGAVAAFSGLVPLPPGGRVLDSACRIGQLAVGLALQGFDVVASDASPAMVQRTAQPATDHRAELSAVTCAWEGLTPDRVGGAFDAVFCVGNSLTHAPGGDARRALAPMASVLRPGGLLVPRPATGNVNAARLRARDRRRARRTAPPPRPRDPRLDDPEAWDVPHFLDVAVTLIDPSGKATTTAERLSFWPFTHTVPDADLRQCGSVSESSTYANDIERYLVTGRRVPTSNGTSALPRNWRSSPRS